jgi:hypothetical protein
MCHGWLPVSKLLITTSTLIELTRHNCREWDVYISLYVTTNGFEPMPYILGFKTSEAGDDNAVYRVGTIGGT